MNGIKCVACGRFVGFIEMENGEAHFEYTPDSDRSTELCDWVCKRCVREEMYPDAGEGATT